MSPFGVVVKISGVDRSGQRFWQTSVLTEITKKAIQVQHLPAICLAGDALLVVYEKKQAEYRVSSRDLDGHARLVAVAPEQCIFPSHLLSPERTPAVVPPASKKEPPKPIAVAGFSKSEKEKRQFERVPSKIPVQIHSGPRAGSVSAVTGDVSAGGCYVEITSPLPVGAEVEIEFAGARQLRVKGRVVTSHAMVGMGIQFAEEHAEIEARLAASEEPATAGTAEPGSVPQVQVRLRGEQAEKLAAELTGWFAEHNSLERAEFTQIFERCAEAD